MKGEPGLFKRSLQNLKFFYGKLFQRKIKFAVQLLQVLFTVHCNYKTTEN